MTTETTVMAILERANPVPPGELVDVPIGATRYLDTALEQRSEPMTIVDPTPTRQSDQGPRRRWPLIAVAASVVAVVVSTIAVVATRDDTKVVDQPDPTLPPTVPDTVPEATGPTPTTVVTPDPTAAQAVIDDFFVAYNSGDIDVALALMSDEVIVTENYGASPSPSSHDPDDPYPVEKNFAWYIAQAGVWTEPTCESEAEQRSTGTTLRCTWGSMQATQRAVGAEPVQTNAIVVVAGGVIVELHLGYGPHDFATLGIKLSEWLETFHPEVEGADCCEGETREESEQRGRLRAQWAQEWAAFLDTYGCSPTGACYLPLAEWVAEYDGQCLQGESPDRLADLLEHMTKLPPPSPFFYTADGLLRANEALLEPGLTERDQPELRRTRLDAMVELGIDERCHPVVE